MRSWLVILTGVLLFPHLPHLPGQTPAKRHGVEINQDVFPQKTPKECLASVLKAIDGKRIDYLLAHLADPTFVDVRVKALGNFDELIRETNAKLADDPGAVKELRRYLKEGEWEPGDEATSVKLKDVKNRGVFFKKIGDRWYMENKQRAETEKK